VKGMKIETKAKELDRNCGKKWNGMKGKTLSI
jgi:hypothetical protein